MFKRSVLGLARQISFVSRQQRLLSGYDIGGHVKASASPWSLYYPSFEAQINFTPKANVGPDPKQQLQPDSPPEESAEEQVKHHKYDIIIDCDRLLDLNGSGWPIHFDVQNELWYDYYDMDKEKNKRFYPEKENSLKTIAVSGIFNSGKTFFVNNFCSANLPSDDKVSTKGLSLKRLTGAQSELLIMDTAGSNSAIEVTDDLSLSDKISSEKILQNTIYDVANFHVCVVNKLTWPDQQHFEMLYTKIKESKAEIGPNCVQQTPLFIVHNFRNHTLQELKDKLLDDIQLAYKQGGFRCGGHVQDAREEFTNLIQQFIDSDQDNIVNNYRSEQEKLTTKIVETIKTSYIASGWGAGSEFIDNASQEINGLVECFMGNHNAKEKQSQFKEKAVAELQKKYGAKHKVWFDSKGDGTTYHVFLVKNDSSPAAQAFNWLVFKQMRDELSSKQTNTANRFSLKKIFDALNSHINQYATFVDKNAQIISHSAPLKPVLGVIGDNNDDMDFRTILHPTLQEVEAKMALKKSSELEYNALFIGATSWKPKYDVMYCGGKCIVWMELPGEISNGEANVIPDYQSEDNHTKLVVTGKREQEPGYPIEIGINDKRDRSFGSFEFKVNLKKEYVTVANQACEDGVLCVEIKPIQTDSGGKFGKKQE